MASERRGVLAGLVGAAVVAVKGIDEGAAPVARGIDELVVAVRRGGDDAADGGDESMGARGAEQGRGYVRRERIESLLERQSASGTFGLRPGWYGGFQVSPDDDSRLRYELETPADQQVDVLLFDAAAFSDYDAGSDGRWRAEGTTLHSSDGQSSVVLTGDRTWYLVVDNTAAGFAPATATVTAGFTMSLDPR